MDIAKQDQQQKEQLNMPDNVSDNIDIFLQVARQYLMKGNKQQIEELKMQFYQLVSKKKNIIKEVNYQIELFDLLYDFVTIRGIMGSYLDANNLEEDNEQEEEKSGDSQNQKNEANLIYQTFLQINQCTQPFFTTVAEKYQKQIVLHIVQKIEQLLEKNQIKNKTLIYAYVEQTLLYFTYSYQVCQNKQVAPMILKLLIQILNRIEQGQMEEEMQKNIGNILIYLKMGSTLIFNCNIDKILSYAIKHKSTHILAGCNFKAKNSEYENFLQNHYEEFLEMFENEMDISQKAQSIELFKIASCIVPEKVIKNVDLFMQLLENVSYKYQMVQTIKILCEKFPQEFEGQIDYFNDLINSSKDTGYMLYAILGSIGQFTKNEQVMRQCLEYLVQQGELQESEYLQLCGQAMKSLCHGGDTQKNIAKNEYMQRLISLKNSTNQPLSQEITQLIENLNKH